MFYLSLRIRQIGERHRDAYVHINPVINASYVCRLCKILAKRNADMHVPIHTHTHTRMQISVLGILISHVCHLSRRVEPDSYNNRIGSVCVRSRRLHFREVQRTHVEKTSRESGKLARSSYFDAAEIDSWQDRRKIYRVVSKS